MTKMIMATVLAVMVMGVAMIPATEPFAPVLEGMSAQSIGQRIERALTPPRPPVRTPTACACVRG